MLWYLHTRRCAAKVLASRGLTATGGIPREMAIVLESAMRSLEGDAESMD